MIPLMKIHNLPNIGQEIQKVWDSGFITEGAYSDKFEQKFGEYIGNENVCLTNSCTNALVLAAHVIGIKPGDEVITTGMTCMATNEPFYNFGANLVFADIDPETGNIDPEDVIRKITKKTKAIVLVHWTGQPADLDEINLIAKENNIKVVEDAAHALRSSYKGKLIGSHSDFVCFSFQAVKHLTTADGGAIACRSSADADRIRKLRWFGLDRKYKGPSRWEQDITESGYKFHMNNVNACIGLLQLEKVDPLIDKHVENAIFYNQEINNSKIRKLVLKENRTSSYWIYSLLVEDKYKFKNYMEENGILVDIAHANNLKYSVFNKFRNSELKNLDFFDSRLMNIPCGWWVSEKDREFIVDIVNNY
jgi:perosamine synthetase